MIVTEAIFTHSSQCNDMSLYITVNGCFPISFPLFFSPSCRDEDDVQVFSLSDQRLVVLEITVTNMPSDPLRPEEDGDDAHAAQLLISLPNTLSYAGSRIPLQVWACRCGATYQKHVCFGFQSKLLISFV